MIKKFWQRIFKKGGPEEENCELLLPLDSIKLETEGVLEKRIEETVVPEKFDMRVVAIAKKTPLQCTAYTVDVSEEQSEVVGSAIAVVSIPPRFREATSKRKCPTCGSSLKICSERMKTKGAVPLSFYVCASYPNCRYRYPLTNV